MTKSMIKYMVSMVVVVSLFSGCTNKDIAVYSIIKEPQSYIANDYLVDNGDFFAKYLGVIDNKSVVGANNGNGSIMPMLLVNITEHEVLYYQNSFQKVYPASITKILTAYVALKYGKLDDVITIGDVSISEAGAKMCGIKKGDKLTLEQLLYGLLVYSGNDNAVAIAQYISGNVPAFCKLMNKEAKLLGAVNTNFKNPHGLHNDKHYTTAYDLYLIFNELVKNEMVLKMISTKEYTARFEDEDGNMKILTWDNSNLYLTGTVNMPSSASIIGGKTGTTGAAGACLILLSQDNHGKQYISVVLKTSNKIQLYNEMTGLINHVN